MAIPVSLREHKRDRSVFFSLSSSLGLSDSVSSTASTATVAQQSHEHCPMNLSSHVCEKIIDETEYKR
jgi:hypothetical protein